MQSRICVHMVCIGLLVFTAACGSDDSGNAPDAAVDFCVESKFAAASEPCCIENGIDACGGGLFCAALDGRTQAVCYAEYSRLDLTECTEDRQCLSRSCDTEAALCRSMPASACDTAVGCAAVGDSDYVCEPELRVCQLVGDGSPGSLCLGEDDCDAGGPTCDLVSKRCARWPAMIEIATYASTTTLNMVLDAEERPLISYLRPEPYGSSMIAIREADDWRESGYSNDSAGPSAIVDVDVDGNGDSVSVRYLSYVYANTLSGENDLSFSVIKDNNAGRDIDDDITLGSFYATSLARDEDGDFHISYRSGEALKYAYIRDLGEDRYSHETFVVDGVLGTDNLRTSLVVRGTKPFIAYNGNGTVHVAEQASGGAWSDEFVSNGLHPSLALDAGGGLHLSFFEAEQIKYAYRELEQWVVETLDIDEAGPISDIAVDDAGNVHISLQDQENGALVYARREAAGGEAGTWVYGVVDREGQVGDSNTIAIGSDGTVHIVYSETAEGRTKYARIATP